MKKLQSIALTSDFGVISIKQDRKALLALTEKNFEVEVTITGRLTGSWSKDDGIDQEFALDVTGLRLGKTVRVPKDKLGRKYAMAAHICVGDKLQCDGGFTCLKEGSIRAVKFDAKADRSRGGDVLTGYYINCNDKAAKKRHYLDGQLGHTPETEGALVGLYNVTKR